MKLLVPSIAAVLGAAVATGAFLFISHRGDSPSISDKTPGTSPAAPDTVVAMPPAVVAAPPLDGRYLLEFDGAKQTRNGQPFPGRSYEEWYGYRSVCTPVGCTATGTDLDSDSNPIPKDKPFRPVFHWADGQWHGGFSFDFDCTHAQPAMSSGEPFPYMPGSETVSESISMKPQPDGSYSGISTENVLTDVCGNGGKVSVNHFVATRYGPPPPGVVADPPMPVQQPR